MKRNTTIVGIFLLALSLPCIAQELSQQELFHKKVKDRAITLSQTLLDSLLKNPKEAGLEFIAQVKGELQKECFVGTGIYVTCNFKDHDPDQGWSEGIRFKWTLGRRSPDGSKRPHSFWLHFHSIQRISH